MKTNYEVLKCSRGYVVVIRREDGSVNDYRFDTKAQMNRWLKAAGLK